MHGNVRCSVALAGILHAARRATVLVGSVVPVRGTPSDIALDERHGNSYLENFSAGRVESDEHGHADPGNAVNCTLSTECGRDVAGQPVFGGG